MKKKNLDIEHTCDASPNKELRAVAYVLVPVPDNTAVGGDELIPNKTERDVALNDDEAADDHRRDSPDVGVTPVGSVSLLGESCSVAFVASSSIKMPRDRLGPAERTLSTAVCTASTNSPPRRFNTGGIAPTPPPGRLKWDSRSDTEDGGRSEMKKR